MAAQRNCAAFRIINVAQSSYFAEDTRNDKLLEGDV